jgi:hypothetical protein
MTLEQLFDRWRARREEWRRLGVRVEGAAICDEVLADVEAVFTSEGQQLLTLTEASRISAYSPDHLGRLLRNGTVPNAGRPNAPRIRLADLPRRPKPVVATNGHSAYDPATDARKLVSRRNGGAHAS